MPQTQSPAEPGAPQQTSAAILTPESLALLPRKRWTQNECRQLVQMGLLDGARYELIEGEVVVKVGQGRLHVFVITRLIAWLNAVFGADHVQSQAPITLSDVSQPEPDAAVLSGVVGDYLERDPGPADLRLVVEVSATTLRADQTVKALLYARAGIAEMWIVNLPERVVEVLRDPGPDGYASVTRANEADLVSPLAAPGAGVRVADLLP